ncbi:hypothetical protein [Bradyrhizobium sp. 6(2017)]|uniref:hypothetical protein n=1 Tax=Bradyrhizobium sp. 6(2017) TaxID=1197460 RepID=UPI0013E1B802|nr:hypothetical protein [Bradyrhizobium sp. 6(2017)]QIG92156.1 hypothetical protein G6P99_06330 [Bradyrhizobium sp. 6(2017)]
MNSSPPLKTGYAERTGDTENAPTAMVATTVTTVTSKKAKDLYTRDRGLDLRTVTGCSGDVVTGSEKTSVTPSISADQVGKKKRRHARHSQESRLRKKLGLIRIWVTVPRTTADFLQDRGYLGEWDTEDREAISAAASRFILANRLFGDECVTAHAPEKRNGVD